jgi:HSP20 family molecular chaperone IbpA
MKRSDSDSITLRDFERACDELFDEWLGRWRGGSRAPEVPAGAVVLDRGERYEVRIEAAVESPEVIEVEVNQTDLIVRIPAGAHPAVERRMTFAQPLDHEQASARWAEGELTIMLPKQRGRRVKVQ